MAGLARAGLRRIVRWAPAVRQQVDDLLRGMLVDAREDVGEVVDGVLAVLLAGVDQRLEDGVAVARFLVADEEEVGAAHRGAAQAALSLVVVEGQRRVARA